MLRTDFINMLVTPQPKTETHTIEYNADFEEYGFWLDFIHHPTIPVTATIAGSSATKVTTVPQAGQFRMPDGNRAENYNRWVQCNPADDGKSVTINYTAWRGSFNANDANLFATTINDLLIRVESLESGATVSSLFPSDPSEVFHALFNETSGTTVADLKGNNATAEGTTIVSTPYIRGRKFQEKASAIISGGFTTATSVTVTLTGITGTFNVNDTITITHPTNTASGNYYVYGYIESINGNNYTLHFYNPGLAFDVGATIWTGTDGVSIPNSASLSAGIGDATMLFLVTPHKFNRHQYFYHSDGTAFDSKRKLTNFVLNRLNQFSGGWHNVTDGANNTVTGTTSFTLEQQYFVAIVRDATAKTTTLYVNGVQDGQTTFTTVADMIDSTAALTCYIGHNIDTNTGKKAYHGSFTIDEMQLLNRKMTLSEIQAIQNSRI